MRAFKAFLIIAFATLPWLAPLSAGPQAAMPVQELVVYTHQHPIAFKVEIAATPEQQSVGLMHRAELPADRGMLFPVREPRHQQMWMKNTRIPLDMIFIDQTSTISHIHPNAVPYSETVIDSHGPIIAVLEINGGLAKKLKIKKGDRVEYAHPD